MLPQFLFIYIISICIHGVTRVDVMPIGCPYRIVETRNIVFDPIWCFQYREPILTKFPAPTEPEAVLYFSRT